MKEAQQKNHLRYIARADVYRLLSACFYQPEEAFLEEDVFGQLKTAMARITPGLGSLTTALEAEFKEPGLEPLQLDYSRLFLGPFEILARPYGSIYLDGEKTVMGDSTLRALEMYREGCFDIAEDFREMPDHIAVELEFLYLVTFNLAQEPEGEGKKKLLLLKRRFLSEHLGAWVSPFADAIRKGAGTDFYRQLANVVENVVKEDLKELKEVS